MPPDLDSWESNFFFTCLKQAQNEFYDKGKKTNKHHLQLSDPRTWSKLQALIGNKDKVEYQ